VYSWREQLARLIQSFYAGVFILVFLIHSVATQNAGYGDKFKKKVKELILEANANRDAEAEQIRKER
jgi:hypothetical protein